MINVRLSEEEENKIKKYAQDHDLTKTQVVREALELYFSKHDGQQPFELGEDLFGQEESGTSNKSVVYKAEIKKKLGEKYSH